MSGVAVLDIDTKSTAEFQITANKMQQDATAASSSIGWQYLKLYVQLCSPDDGRRNGLKHVERL